MHTIHSGLYQPRHSDQQGGAVRVGTSPRRVLRRATYGHLPHFHGPSTWPSCWYWHQCCFRTLFRTFRTCSERSEHSERSEQSHVPNNLANNVPNNAPYNVECQQSACLVRMIWVEDQHAQAQHWLMHAQAPAQHWFMHAQAQARHWFMHAQAQAQLHRKRLRHPDLACTASCTFKISLSNIDHVPSSAKQWRAQIH